MKKNQITWFMCGQRRCSERNGSLKSLEPPFLGSIYSPLALGTCAERVREQISLAVLGKACSLLPVTSCTEALSDPSHIYCIWLGENYYDRFKVPVFCFIFLLHTHLQWYSVRGKKLLRVLGVPERYSNEARCFGTRCCVDPEVVVTC